MVRLRQDNKRLKEEVEVLRKASAFSTVGGEDMNAKLAFIAAHMAEHAVRLMCRVLGVSRSHHAWRRKASSKSRARHQA